MLFEATPQPYSSTSLVTCCRTSWTNSLLLTWTTLCSPQMTLANTHHVWVVLERLHQHGLFAKLEKYTVGQASTEFHGFILSFQGLKYRPLESSDHPRVEGTPNHEGTPKIPGLYQLLLVVHHLCPDGGPLTQLLHKAVKFYWSREARQAFEYLKQALTARFERDRGSYTI